MVEWMLANIICSEFDKVVGKGCGESGKAMHIGFGTRCRNETDQYQVWHLYLHAPSNYVYVALQEERIDSKGRRHVGKMTILSYHDSCWRDAVEQFIFKNRSDLNVFRSFDRLFEWYDVLTLSEDEKNYLRRLENFKMSYPTPKGDFPELNPFDQRGLWAGKAEDA